MTNTMTNMTEQTPSHPFDLEQYLAELKPLINVDCGTWTPAGVHQIADLMSEKYQSLGWQVERHDLGEHDLGEHDLGEKVGPGLLATNKPEAEEYDILLIGHMDTVFPEGTIAEWSFSQDGEKSLRPRRCRYEIRPLEHVQGNQPTA